MDFLPIFIDLKGHPVLVVGAEDGAHNKVELLLKTGAKVTLLAAKLTPTLEDWASQGLITHSREPFTEGHLEGIKLVIVASEDDDLAAQVSRAAQARNLPVNVVDYPELCSFIVPSIVDRSPLVMAVSSSGNCPRLSRLVRAKLEILFPQSYSRLATFLGELRHKSQGVIEDQGERRVFWDRLFTSPLLEMFLSGKEKMASEGLEKALEEHHKKERKYGQVALVGAGPGDPDLLTLRALRLIQNADVLVYDRLVSPVILDYARREATKIYVGKKSSDHTMPQEEINQQVVELAKAGNSVVRLKGGDPFIFGRGGEEIELLVQAGIEFEVVPGVTAASGCGTYAGIPLTHRDYAQSVRMVTGHMKKDGSLDLDWPSLASKNTTLVFYMGLSAAGEIGEQLTQHGLDPKTPVALIERGTTYDQQVLTGTLENLGSLALKSGFHPPTLIICGQVVALRDRLNWYNPGHFDNEDKATFLTHP